MGAAVLMLLASACGDDGGGGGDDGGSESGPIDWWTIQPSDGELGQLWVTLGNEFSTANAESQVTNTPYENDAFKSALTTAVQGEDPPDLYQSWGGGVLREQVEAGQVRDLTDELADVIATISPGALQPYTIDGRVYGLPWNMGMVGFWYNTELFEEAGITAPPATWSEFLTVVQQLKDAGITPIALGEADRWPGHFWFAYLAMRTAGLPALQQAYDNNSLDNPGFVQAGQLLEELVAMDPFQEGWQSVGYEEGDGQSATMGNGDAAMELMGHWAPRAQVQWAGLQDESGEPTEEGQAVLDARGFFPFPTVEGGAGAATEIFGGGDGFAVGGNAPDSIFDFIRHIYQNYQRVIDSGGVVTVINGATPEDPTVLPVLETLSAGTGFQLYLDQDWPPAVADEVLAATEALYNGQASPEEVVSRINEVWGREG